MSEFELNFDTHLYDNLDMAALRRALKIQLPLVEQLGSLRASIVGMHIYQFALTQNWAALDRVVLLLCEYKASWPEALRTELEQAAVLRADERSPDWQQVYRSEAEHLLLLAAFSSPARDAMNHSLRQYQLYACSHLLGDKDKPAFLTLEEIEALLQPQTCHPVSLFARQFSERQRKPELLARELAAHFAALD